MLKKNKKPLKAVSNTIIDKPYKPEPKYQIQILKDNFSDLWTWLKEISRFCKVEDFIYISDYKKKENTIRIKIFTKSHYYTISVHLGKDHNYLGCISRTRKSRAGENWLRGRDLADGKYNYKTWQEIKNDILAMELVKVVRKSPDIDEK